MSHPHGPGLSSSTGARIVLIERPGCHLCEDAATIAHRVARQVGCIVEHKNIEDDDELARRWSLEIPVVAVDGAVVSVYRVSEDQLQEALTRKPRRWARFRAWLGCH